MQRGFGESSKGVCAKLAGFLGWRSVALLAMVAATGLLARAQMAGTGAIAGTVTDSTGAVVANATITVTSVETNENTVRTTTGAGDYDITPLTPGVYTVTVTAQGFRTFIQQNVTVNALETVPLDIKLAIGQSVQTVTVSTAPPVLDTTNATLGAVMDNQMYSSLPLLMGAGGNPDQRRATDFANLMPGVSQVWVGSGNATDASTSVNGGNPAGGVSEIYIDGVNLPEADGIGDPRFTWTAFGVDAIDQFQVQTSAYSAQFAGQGVQNYSIKQGSNNIHGSVYDYLRNTALDAWLFTAKSPVVTGAGGGACTYLTAPSSTCAPGGIKQAEHMNEYGMVIGGPIIKNKLFLFYNFGGYRYSAGPKPGAQTIPTAAMMGYSPTGTPLGYADFSGWSGANGNENIYDPGTQVETAGNWSRTQFANNQIPGNRISQAAAFINKYMEPYEALALQNVYSNNIVVGYPSGLSNWFTAGRFDYMMNSRNQISAIIAFGRQASTGPNSVGATNQLGPPFNTNQSYAPQTTVDILKDTFTINPHIVNQAAVAFGRYRSLSVTPDELPQYSVSNSGILNAPSGQASFFPGIKWSGGLDLPTTEADYDENLKVNNTYTAMDNVQWELGKQNLTFGGQVVEVQFNYYKNLSFSSPFTLTFANTQTQAFTTGTNLNSSSGDAFASYMLGAVSTSSVTVGTPGLGSRWLDPSFWVQDDYKFSPKLTVNLGVRWDTWPAVHEAHNLITWLDTTGQNAVTGNRGTLAFAGGNSSDGYHTGVPIPSSMFWKNISPRLGAAYALDSKTVIRASYGLDFARGDWTSGSQSGSPSVIGFQPSAVAAAGTVSAPSYYWDNTQCAASAADGVPCGWTGSVLPPSQTIPTTTSATGGTSLAMFGTSETNALTTTGAQGMTYWDPYLGSRTPEYINWTFGIERQITNDMSISVSYVGSEGHFISTGSNKAIGSRNNELPESMAALAGYNTTGAACSGASCTTPLLTATNGTNAANPTANLTTAIGLGFTPPNPYNAADSVPYYKNSVASYFEPFPQYSGVSDTTGFVGNENWNALELTIRQRPSHGLNWMLNYTYSKSVDDLGTFRVGDNDRLDRSISNGNIPQNLTATAVYQLPIGKGHMWGENWAYRAIASDWSLSNITSFHTGFPIMLTGQSGTCGQAGILNQCMPSIISGQAGRVNGGYGKHVTTAPGSPNYFGTQQYLNYAAFTVATAGTAANYGTSVSTPAKQETYVGNGPALYVPGNASRGASLGLYGMGYYDVDLALRRSFPVWRETSLAFEADMTNVTNHVVWNSPNAVVDSGSLGELTGITNQPRDVQLSLRINF